MSYDTHKKTQQHNKSILVPSPPPPPLLYNMNTNKKMEKPKRPLSAYNLFYRYKRILLLKLKVSNDDTEYITKLMTTPPGLDYHPLQNI